MDSFEEEENVLAAIFEDSFPDSQKGNPGFVRYLSELTSYGVDRLRREPERLEEERVSIKQETEELAFDNYQTFIQTAECSKSIYQDFQGIESRVTDTLDKLPAFANACRKFMKTTQEISQSRKSNSLSLQRHTAILEILEIPQLMDTCVRNSYYDDALELASYVRRLEKKHSSTPIIKSICADVSRSYGVMLSRLLQELSGDVTLPVCLRHVGHLRRMDVYTETELRIRFLQARDKWFQGLLSNVPTADSYAHLTKVIEISRVSLFDIITQYRAIFTDDDPMLSTSVTGTGGHQDQGAPDERSLFQNWALRQVSQFLAILRADLYRGVGSQLESVLGQCMYFGLSFSRVGCDFRGLVAAIFQEVALKMFQEAVVNAETQFEESMNVFSFHSISSGMPSSSSKLSAEATSLSAPMSLVKYAPLAHLSNEIMSAFNQLRLCSPLSLACDVTQALHASLEKAIAYISTVYKTDGVSFTSEEKAAFCEMCRVTAEDFLPFLNICLSALFPTSELLTYLGASLSDVAKSVKHLAQLDIESLLVRITEHLPKKPLPLPVKRPVFEVGASSDEETITRKSGDIVIPKSLVDNSSGHITERVSGTDGNTPGVRNSASDASVPAEPASASESNMGGHISSTSSQSPRATEVLGNLLDSRESRQQQQQHEKQQQQQPHQQQQQLQQQEQSSEDKASPILLTAAPNEVADLNVVSVDKTPLSGASALQMADNSEVASLDEQSLNPANTELSSDSRS